MDDLIRAFDKQAMEEKGDAIRDARLRIQQIRAESGAQNQTKQKWGKKQKKWSKKQHQGRYVFEQVVHMRKSDSRT